MIIVNGNIRFLDCQSEAGIDEATGYAKDTSLTEGNPVPCQYTSKMNLLTSENGEPVTRISYTILCEHLHPSAITERLRLYDYSNQLVGDFSVQSIEPLRAVCQTRITV